MDTFTATTTRQVSDVAAHMGGMTTHAMQAIAADALRRSTVFPNYDAAHHPINEAARKIAEVALALTGGRATYSWEGNGIRLTYTGDTTDDNGDFAYGPTLREYLVGGVYKTTSPVPSQSGTGLLNLSLDHVKDCPDPIVEAKRQIAWLLLDPSLDLVDYVVRTTTSWQAMNRETQAKRTALAIRLAEIVEQKVLENPGAGLDLRDLAKGTNVVGYMVKTLDGSIFNVMKRVKENEDKQSTTLDTPADEDGSYRMQVAEIPADMLPRSAEDSVIGGTDDLRAMLLMEAQKAEEERVAAAKAANKAAVEKGESKPHVVRSRRASENSAIVSRTFFAQTGLPALKIPSIQTRLSLLDELAAEDDAYETLVADAAKKAEELAAKLTEETGQVVKVKPEAVTRELSVAYHSFMDWFSLLRGDEYDTQVSDEWLSLWQCYTIDDAEQMMAMVGTHPERLAKIAEGALVIPEPMNAATKKRVRDMMRRMADQDQLNELVAAAVIAYDAFVQGGDVADWNHAAGMVVEHPAAPANITSTDVLAAAFDEFAAALVY